jgi:hypothetical protein
MSTEKTIQTEIHRELGGRADVRVFRNNVGTAYMGKAFTIKQAGVIRLFPGDVVIRGARRVKFGLHKGSGDLIGWRSVLITPAMVGRRIAQFLSAEVKTPKGRATAEQTQWAQVVNNHGGCAGVVRSVDDARALADRGEL